MKKAAFKECFAIELSGEMPKRMPLKEGDWLVVRWLNGKEMVLERPGNDYWDETFAWGRKFAKEKKINPAEVIRAVSEIRSGR